MITGDRHTKAILGLGYWDVLKIVLNVYLFSLQPLPALNFLLASLGLTLDETHFAIVFVQVAS